MKALQLPAVCLAIISLALPACHKRSEHEEQGEHQKIIATSPKSQDVVLTQQYVCQIRSQTFIEMKALGEGYLDEILIKEGQVVKQGDLLFKVVPIVYQAKRDAEAAEAAVALQEYKNTERLFESKIVSANELAIYKGKLDKALAVQKAAEAELNFTYIKAPFDGIVDRQQQQKGSLVKKEEILTTLSDNSVMRVYFNVPEARYLEYMAGRPDDHDRNHIELVLANGSKFPHAGRMVGPLASCDSETGNFRFRADFPNPDRLLRHGQTGNVLIHRTLKNAIVIPQRATFEILDKRYVFVIGHDHVVHQREIAILHELEDLFVIKNGVGVDDHIVLEGIRQVRDGQKLEFEFRQPDEVIANQKNKAE